MHELLELSLRHIQGDLFEYSVEKGFASIEFIDAFMNSKCAAALDMDINKLQWMGTEYLMDTLIDELGNKLVPGEIYSKDAMFWAGYIYRYWHFSTGESSKEISKQASGERILRAYPYYHTVAEEIAIEDLKEEAAYRSAKKKRGKVLKGELVLAPSAAKRLR